MSIKIFELFHGGVITKLLRSDKPITLRMIETHPDEKWSIYTLNDEIDLFITFSKKPREFSREGGGTSWTFQFSDHQQNQISEGRRVHIALVCASNKLDNANIPVCLIKEEKLQQLGTGIRSITVRLPRGRGQFRIMKDRKEVFKVPQSGLDSWEI